MQNGSRHTALSGPAHRPEERPTPGKRPEIYDLARDFPGKPLEICHLTTGAGNRTAPETILESMT
jgi:hypothetical protein